MGVLPLQFAEGTNAQTLKLDGSETYAIAGLSDMIEPGQMATLEITRKDGTPEKVPVKLRIDTPIEIDYYRHGGILPFVLRELMARK
jgi:aconitate hydratase